MYPDFIESGYTPLLFWDLSLGEVVDCIEGYERKLLRKQKQREAALHDETYMLYMQALQFGNVLSCILDKSQPLKGLEAYYPNLYKPQTTEESQEEANNFTEQEERDKHQLTPEMEAYKADMDDFVFRHNLAMAKKRGENGGRNDTGKTAGNNRGTD